MCSASPQCQQYARPAAEAMAVAAPEARRLSGVVRVTAGVDWSGAAARRSMWGQTALCRRRTRRRARRRPSQRRLAPPTPAPRPRTSARREAPGPRGARARRLPPHFFSTNHHASKRDDSRVRREHDHQRAVPDAGGGQHVIERAKARGDGLVLIFLIFFVPVASFVFATANTADTANTEARDARRPPPQTPQALLGELRGGGGGGDSRRTALRATAVSGSLSLQLGPPGSSAPTHVSRTGHATAPRPVAASQAGRDAPDALDR